MKQYTSSQFNDRISRDFETNFAQLFCPNGQRTETGGRLLSTFPKKF